MMCEPQVFGLRVGSGLAKLPSDGQAGGPRLGLDTSLICVLLCFIVCDDFKFCGIYFKASNDTDFQFVLGLKYM